LSIKTLRKTGKIKVPQVLHKAHTGVKKDNDKKMSKNY